MQKKQNRTILLGEQTVRKELRARAWCPPDSPRILWALARDRAITVRFEAAININTPHSILDRLASDPHPMVRWAARRKQYRQVDADRIPLQAALSILRLHPIRNKIEIIYRFARLGLFEFTSDGRVWQTGSLHMNRDGRTFRFVRQKAEVLRVVREKGRPYYEVRVWWLHMAIACPAHRLIYRAFKGFTPYGYQVHHVDGCTLNNDPKNLELLSREQHRRTHMVTPGISKRMNAKQLRYLRRMVEEGLPKWVIMHRTGIHFKTLNDTIKRAGWHYKPWPKGKPWPHKEAPRRTNDLPLDREQAARIRSMLELGMPKTVIARMAGISVNMLFRIIRQTGWTVKPWPTAKHWPLDENGMARPEDGRTRGRTKRGDNEGTEERKRKSRS